MLSPLMPRWSGLPAAIRARALSAALASESAAVNPDTAWLPLLAVSMAHAERVEVRDAHKFAERSITECRKAGELICPPHEEARISIYYGQLDAGLKSGIDPRLDPDQDQPVGGITHRPSSRARHAGRQKA